MLHFSPPGNLLSLNILLRCNLELKLVYRQLVTALLVWDLVFILLSLLLYTLPHWDQTYGQK